MGDPNEAQSLWVLLDEEDQGFVSSEAFVNGCLRLRGSARPVDLATCMHNMRSRFNWITDEIGIMREHLAIVVSALAVAQVVPHGNSKISTESGTPAPTIPPPTLFSDKPTPNSAT